MYGSFDRRRSIYQGSLSSQELRLLRPLSFSHDSLHFEVTTFRRSAIPPYTAVSYTWGDESTTETIHINGCSFRVRPNLWSCLYYLSQAKSHFGWEYLWVDAICINQSDNQEKSAQVRYMDQTYKDASCVSVWLGLPALPEHVQMERLSNTPIRTLDVDPYDWVDQLSDLSNRPYWSRYWVIQEFLLGGNLRLHCGNTSMDWFDFQDLVYRVEGIQHPVIDYDSPPSISSEACAALPLLMGRSFDRFPEVPQTLHILLIQHCNSQCKDPRDRVFALLGLVSQDERSLLGRSFPDYALSERHVLIIALAHLTQYRPVPYSLEKITPESEDLFRGLGVASKRQRKELLRCAADIDYLGYESGAEVLAVLVLHDELESAGPAHPVLEPGGDIWAFYEPESSSRRSWTLAVSIVGIFAGLAVALSRWRS